MQTLEPFAAFWLDQLSDELLWRTSILTAELWREFKEQAGRYPGTESTVGMRLKKLFPTSRKARARTPPTPVRPEGGRVRIYELPEVGEARLAFEAHVGRVVEWPALPDSDEVVQIDSM